MKSAWVSSSSDDGDGSEMIRHWLPARASRNLYVVEAGELRYRPTSLIVATWCAVTVTVASRADSPFKFTGPASFPDTFGDRPTTMAAAQPGCQVRRSLGSRNARAAA